jgi:hypothetical protein
MIAVWVWEARTLPVWALASVATVYLFAAIYLYATRDLAAAPTVTFTGPPRWLPAEVHHDERPGQPGKNGGQRAGLAGRAGVDLPPVAATWARQAIAWRTARLKLDYEPDSTGWRLTRDAVLRGGA